MEVVVHQEVGSRHVIAPVEKPLGERFLQLNEWSEKFLAGCPERSERRFVVINGEKYPLRSFNNPSLGVIIEETPWSKRGGVGPGFFLALRVKGSATPLPGSCE